MTIAANQIPVNLFLMAFFKLLHSKTTTSYTVTRDGALVLDRDALLRSGKMKDQFDAAAALKEDQTRARRSPSQDRHPPKR